jgi:hypothetical protein
MALPADRANLRRRDTDEAIALGVFTPAGAKEPLQHRHARRIRRDAELTTDTGGGRRHACIVWRHARVDDGGAKTWRMKSSMMARLIIVKASVSFRNDARACSS